MWNETYAYSELPGDEETAEELEFVSRVLELEKGAVILDLCCGQGRHSVGLADMGYSVIGLDSSRSLLDMAREVVSESSLSRLWFVEGDMRNIPIREGMCDAAINFFTSFGFFDDAGNLQVLKSVASVLKPGGKFLLDYWNPYMADQLDGTRNWWWITDSLLALAEAQYDFSTGRLRDLRTIVDVENSSVENAVREVRFYTLPELEKMLEEAGLHVLEVYGDIDEREYDGESRRLITVSEKE
jgi:ubiquinone/menaquinone biosynthesis C-methylase UbiE